MGSNSDASSPSAAMPPTRGYQQELLDESLRRNLIIALDTGSGKTHIAILRMKIEAEQEPEKVSWFLAPTVALCEQQRRVISIALPVAVGLISGALEPDQWKDAALWRRVLKEHRIIVSTPQVLLDALRHGYLNLGRDVNLLLFDEAHHAVRDDPYNMIMKEFYFDLPKRGYNGSVATTSDGRMPVRSPVRPMILGLTASPIFGGNNVDKAFVTLEANLDSTIRSSRLHRDELANFVHRPVFKHALYRSPVYTPQNSGSRNFDALQAVILDMDIERDPYVKSLRKQLAEKRPGSSEWLRADQRLSKAIRTENTYTHKGLKDFSRAAEAICWDVGPWAADWYVEKVLEQARAAMGPYDNAISTWQNQEKTYLLDLLAKINTVPVSYDPKDIIAGISAKVQVLVECLLAENAGPLPEDELFRSLVFVTRRDTVIALAEVLSQHPSISGLFTVGCLLGSSDSSYRHSFLDITRKLLNRSQNDTLSDFDMGETNLLVATSVAEEGIDIQACGSVIRWDPPANMVSWAQSRGRARRQKSTFTLLFEDSGVDRELVEKWIRLEREMMNLYNDSRRDQRLMDNNEDNQVEDEDNDIEFCVGTTGALVTLKSVVAHLNHFCSVLPNASHGAHLPIYDIDPPDMPVGWHSFEDRSRSTLQPYEGPFGSTVTLPRLLPRSLRVFTVDRNYRTKRSAHRHAAFKAYIALYEAGLLSEHLLPLTSVIEPELEEEVVALLKDVEKRSGTTDVAGQMDPWAPADGSDDWWSTELVVDGLPPLQVFTRNRIATLSNHEFPVLYRPHRDPLKVAIRPSRTVYLPLETLGEAREYTRRLFWGPHGSRMKWDNLDFAYLFLPVKDPDETRWNERRLWLSHIGAAADLPGQAFFANAGAFGQQFSFPDDLTLVRSGDRTGKAFQFLRWQFDAISLEEDQELRERYARFSDLSITPPLLVVQPLPRRMNFLIPIIPKVDSDPPKEKPFLLLPQFSTIDLFSPLDIEYGLLLPSIIRYLSMAGTACSFRETLLSPSLSALPLDLLTTAITAPVSQEHTNYQRLETLGDTVLKFCAGIQLLSEYPLWHEGYLAKKKDHAVSNVRLAKDAHSKRLYRWIIRDRFIPRKWKPKYLSVVPDFPTANSQTASGAVLLQEQESSRNTKQKQELSTKVLADVVESMIGAAYLHGGFDLAIECAAIFGLGLKWEPLSPRVEKMLSRVENVDSFPTQTTDVERMLGYTFTRKLLLVEALTHASHQHDLRTISYERMEFLGDSVLDMVVTDYLYHAPGKQYAPGGIHLRKSAVVNAHFLGFVCLQCSLALDANMPRPNGKRGISVVPENQQIYLWQCLLHSSSRILDDQSRTSARYQRDKKVIEAALSGGKIFPWAALTRLQAPKFLSDMVESLIGAVYLDSEGDLDVVRQVLRKLKILPTLERIVRDNVDVLHPVSRVAEWASKHSKEIEYVFEKEGGKVTCVVNVDGKEATRSMNNWGGRASQEEVKFAAAESLIQQQHILYEDTLGTSEDGDEGDEEHGNHVYGLAA